jgi:hypothetical protein
MICGLVSVLVAYGLSPQPWPYPTHPAGVHVYHETGVVTDVLLGNHNGGLRIRLPNGAFDHFYIAQPNKVNGRHYFCQVFPRVGERFPNKNLCSERPPIIVGETRVRVTWWWSSFENHRVKISDEMDTVP